MKSYTDIVNREYKIRKKKSFLAVIGIFIGVLLLTSVLGVLSYERERKLNQVNYWGEYDVKFDYNEDAKDIISKLDKNSYVDVYGQYSKGEASADKLEKNIYAVMIDDKIINDIAKKALDYYKITIPSEKNKVLASNRLKDSGVKKGDKINIEGADYIVDGFFEYYDYMVLGHFNGKQGENVTTLTRTYGDRKTIENNIDELSKNIGYFTDEQTEDYYEPYPYRMVNGERLSRIYGINNTERYIELGIIVVIMFITIITSYGLMNYALTDKIKQFGILRCIGATPKQIRTLVYKEIFMTSIMAIIPAIIVGYGVSAITVLYLNSKAFFTSYGAEFGINIEVVLLVIGVSILTIFLATVNPARKASKVSPIEGVKSNYKANIKPKKYRITKFIRRIFGIEADIAYRNLRAKSSIFWVSTILLIVSFVGFVTMTFFMQGMMDATTYSLDGQYEFGAGIYLSDEKKEESMITEGMEASKAREYINDYNKKSFNEFYKNSKDKLDWLEKYTDKVIEYNDSLRLDDILFEGLQLKEGIKGEDYHIYNVEDGIDKTELGILAIDEDFFNIIKDEIKGPYENISYEDFKDSAIVVDRISQNMKFEIEQIIDYKKGDSLNIRIPYKEAMPEELEYDRESNKYIFKENFTKIYKENSISKSIPIIGEIQEVNIPIQSHYFGNSGVYILVSDEFVEKNIEDFSIREVDNYYRNNYSFDLKKGVNKEEFIKAYEKIFSEDYLFNGEENLKQMNEVMGVMKTVFYGFLAMLIIILIMSIMINKKLTLESRRAEYGGLLALGMEKSAITRTILYEGIIQFIIVVAVAIPLTSMIAEGIVIYFRVNSMPIESSDISIMLYSIAIVGVILVTIITSLLPMQMFKKFDMVEMMKGDE